MPDNNPRDWSEAFAALPLETPPAGGWERVSAGAAHRGRGSRRSYMGLAAAAALGVILVAPWERREPRTEPPIAAAAAPTNATKLQDLYAESARLEALLAIARDDRVASASAALLSYELDTHVAAIDAALARPGLADDERLKLWRARVDALRRAAGFESTQRLLASQGRSDVMLVSVD